MKELSLYLHIPFCIRKCLYCDFLSAPDSEGLIEHYTDALIAELRNGKTAYQDNQVVTVFFGGGTPSLLSGDLVSKLMDCIRQCYHLAEDAEISMEMNPGTVTKESLLAYKAAGINRISIGLQSANDEELRCLGRIHSFDDFLMAWNLAKEAGFTNRNIDLMEGIPNQSLASFEKTLRSVAALHPEHISAYSLIVEEGTPFYEKYNRGVGLPDEDTERAMYEMTGRILGECGYSRYEISNYAKEGFASRHNIGYWTGRAYVGFGIGASSYVNHTRWKNIADLHTYLSLCENASFAELMTEKENLTKQDEMAEFMFLGLRLMCGVSKQEFERRFHTSMDAVYKAVLEKHEKEGLLVNGDIVMLTNEGISVSNYVMADFLF